MAKAGDIETIKENYRKFLLLENESEHELGAILQRLDKEEHYSDQMVVELMERYPLQRSQTASILKTLSAEGSWIDIDYNDPNRSGWQPKKHLERILALAKAYNTANYHYYESAEVAEAINNALRYWFRAKPVCPNWWYNDIGCPKIMGAILVLSENQICAENKQSAIEYMKQSKFGMTGQNKVGLAGNILVRALIENDTDLVRSARDTIFSEIRMGDTEGIKPDHSFHQHGAQQQFGNYGAGFISSMAFWSQVLKGTSLVPGQSQLDLISDLINEGYSRILWKGYMDINALGRQLFRNAQRHKAFSVAFSAATLADSDPANSYKYKELLDNNFYRTAQPAGHTGLYHFRMSDMTVHRRPGWMASVKMSSPRVIGAEAGNGDNLKGYYLADGATYTYVDGKEYENIFPVWDWRKIPGITSYETDAPLKLLDWDGYRNQSPFVGNVTDGHTGITSMYFDRDGISGRKSWIFTDDFILCLGAGIKADSGLVVTTSIEQRVKYKANLQYLKGNRWTKTKTFDFIPGQDARFFYDKTGYIVFSPAAGKAISEKRTGVWKDIMNMYPSGMKEEKEVVSIWMDHGKDPQNGSYRYLILPQSTPDKVKNFDPKSIVVNSNTRQFQSVTIGKTTYVAAYPLADIRIMDGIQLQSTNTGLFMISREGNRIKVIVSDPTQMQQTMDISINGQVKTVNMPGGDMKGTPVEVYFEANEK